MVYSIQDNIVTLTIDDGKVNVIGIPFLDELNAGLERALADRAGAVIIKGRDKVFSSGFDLNEIRQGRSRASELWRKGFETLVRVYGYPLPLIAACTGHAIAVGALLVMACDRRVGSDGNFRFRIPEASLGMEVPPVMMELLRARISPLHLTRVVLQSEIYNPQNAVQAGFIDEVVEIEDLHARTTTLAKELALLPKSQYAANKQILRAQTLESMRKDIKRLTRFWG